MNAVSPSEFWRLRLDTPNYRIGEAARYARINPQTVSRWHRTSDDRPSVFSPKDGGAALSYLQLVEVAVVATFRSLGVSLKRIDEARRYFKSEMKADFPFAQFKFKTDGKKLWAGMEKIEGESGKDKLLGANDGGQLAWERIIGPRLMEFDYDHDLALTWHVAGRGSSIIIDPRIAFGAPSLRGIPTAVLADRYKSDPDINYISEDYDIDPAELEQALKFERIIPSTVH